MSDPKRYSRRDIYDVTYQAAGDECLPEPSKNGEFVRWEDYAELKADFERIRKHRNTLIERLDKAIEDIDAKDKWHLISTAFLSQEDWMLGYYTTEHSESLVDVIFRWSDGTFTDSCDNEVKPTHWMPLPKPPAAKDGKETL